MVFEDVHVLMGTTGSHLMKVIKQKEKNAWLSAASAEFACYCSPLPNQHHQIMSHKCIITVSVRQH